MIILYLMGDPECLTGARKFVFSNSAVFFFLMFLINVNQVLCFLFHFHALLME